VAILPPMPPRWPGLDPKQLGFWRPRLGFWKQRLGFWRRQFAPERTPVQVVFDIFFGIAMPIVCFALAPSVLGDVFPGIIPPFLYGAVVPQIFGCALWPALGQRLGRACLPTGWVLIGGGILALVTGLLMLPLTLIGLFSVIGLLGFTPFFTGFVYIRSGVRALRASRSERRPHLAVTIALAAFLLLALPGAVQIGVTTVIDRAMQEVLQGDPAQAQPAIDRLSQLAFFVDARPIADEYRASTAPKRRAYLEYAHMQITGYPPDMWED
jgi:hypothetical protein